MAGQAAGNFGAGQDPGDLTNYSLLSVGGSAMAVARGIVNGILSGLGSIGGRAIEAAINLSIRKGFLCPPNFPCPGIL